MRIKIKIHGLDQMVDSQLIYKRIFESENLDGHLKEFLSFELSPFPSSLFKEIEMRRTNKLRLYKIMKPVNYTDREENVTYIIDGLFLLFGILPSFYHQGLTTIDGIIPYIRKNFGSNVVVVFEAFSDNSRNTKAMEEMGRLSEEIKMFLESRKKMATMIEQCIKVLSDNDIPTKIAKSDAEVLIVKTAIVESTKSTVIIVGVDIDLLVILIGRSREYKNEIFLNTYGKAYNVARIYSNKSLNIFPNSPEFILFIHAFAGCDATSAMYRKDKFGLIKLLKEKPDLSEYVDPFIKSETPKNTLFDNGIRIFLAIYDAPQSENCIDNWRYKKFLEAKKAKKIVDLAMLPPTSEAARQHIYRVYYQIQTWLGKDLNPDKWGWFSSEGILKPTTTTKVFPENLLNKLFCNCKTECTSSNCECKQANLRCSNVCGICKGNNCENHDQDDSEARGGFSGPPTDE